MKELLTYYKMVGVEASSIQLAVLEEVTYGKVMRTGADQAFSKSKAGFKWLTDKVGIRAPLKTDSAPTTAEKIMERSTYWREHSKESIDRELLRLLAERLSADPSDIGCLSTKLIEEAAAGYALSDNLLLSQTAVLVARRYVEDCQEGLREKLNSQSPEEAKATDSALRELLDRLTANERLEIQKSLGLESLSAQSVREVVLRSGIPLAGIAAVQAGGFGGYLALTTVMHAVFTSMLGLTLPFAAYTTATSALSVLTGPFGIAFSLGLGTLGYVWGRRKIQRSQYAMLVFACVAHAGESLIPPTALLPSVQAHRLLGEGDTSTSSVAAPPVEASDFQDFKLLTAEKQSAETRAEEKSTERQQTENKVRSLEAQLKRAQDIIDSFSHKQAASTGLNAALEKFAKNQEIDKIKLQLELDATTRLLDERLRVEATEKATAAATFAKQEAHLERRSKDLLALWQVRFKRIHFESAPLRWAAKQDFSTRLEIERALIELQEARDPKTLSRGKMHVSGDAHSRFTTGDGTECRIYYESKAGVIIINKMGKKKNFEKL